MLIENMLLRQQFVLLKRRTKQTRLTWRDGTLLALLASRLRHWKSALLIVQAGDDAVSRVTAKPILAGLHHYHYREVA